MEESWFPLHVLKKMTSHLKNTKERGAKRTSTEMEYFRAIARKDVGTVRTLLAKEPLLVQTVHYEENIVSLIGLATNDFSCHVSFVFQ